MKDLVTLIEQAYQRIASRIVKTPLLPSHFFSSTFGSQVYLKCEFMQHTGSFKFRGALAKLTLNEKADQELIAASSGNHGKAVAYAAQLLGKKPTIYLPNHACPSKKVIIESLGAKAVMIDGDCGFAESCARADSVRDNKLFVSPYNDLDVISGQGTIGIEIIDQIKNLDAIFISVGGGGLIAGIASFLKSINPNIEIVACFPQNAPVMYEALSAGSIIPVKELPTLSDATAGSIEQGSITLGLCHQLIDKNILVSEDEISNAMKLIAYEEKFIIEGAAAVAVAAFIKTHRHYSNKKTVLLLCGRNIELSIFNQAISK